MGIVVGTQTCKVNWPMPLYKRPLE